MSDIRIVQIKTPFQIDLDWALLSDGQLDETKELATAVTVALGTDSLASLNDVLPDIDSTDRRGWWGDIDAEEIWNGWPIGSRLWLLSRAKITGPEAEEGATLARAEQYARESLQPFIDNKIASRIIIDAEQTARDRIDMQIQIFRGPLPEVQLRYQFLWEDMIAGN